MLPRSRLPIPVGAPPAHPLHRMRSEGALRAKDTQRTLHRLRSLGQISPPPQEPVPLPPPPIPPRSPFRPKSLGDIRHTRQVPPSMDLDVSQPSLLDSASVCSLDYSQDGGEVQTADTEYPIDGDTALPQGCLDSTAVASNQIQSSSHGPDLGDLSQLLLLRGLLQETGCTFSPEGEMLTYGNPTSEADFQQMLHLGPLYDEKWIKYFDRDSAEAENGLGPDIRVLKRMLQNEGIKFDGQHQRTSYISKLLPKLLRLCEQYDVLLREEWLAKMQNIHPALRGSFEDGPETRPGLGMRRDFGERPHTMYTVSRSIAPEVGTVPPTPPSEPRTSSASPRPVLSLIIPLRPRGGNVVPQPLVRVPSPPNSPKASNTMLADEWPTSAPSIGPDENRRSRPRRRQDHTGTVAAVVADERKRTEEQKVREDVLGGDDPVESGDNKKSEKTKGMWKRMKGMFGRKKT